MGFFIVSLQRCRRCVTNPPEIWSSGQCIQFGLRPKVIESGGARMPRLSTNGWDLSDDLELCGTTTRLAGFYIDGEIP
ncbi:MAG: hypothetical protein ABW170_22800 [Candidatus Thiodiazotropha sp. L084R]